MSRQDGASVYGPLRLGGNFVIAENQHLVS